MVTHRKDQKKVISNLVSILMKKEKSQQLYSDYDDIKESQIVNQ